jgi:hypothetical protein
MAFQTSVKMTYSVHTQSAILNSFHIFDLSEIGAGRLVLSKIPKEIHWQRPQNVVKVI